MLIARTGEVGDPLAPKKRVIPLHAGGHGANGELAELLSIALAVENRRP